MDDRELVRYFAGLARRLMGEGSVQETMTVIVASAAEVIGGCDHSSISYKRGDSLISASSNDDVGKILDGIQTGAGEGPCLDSIRVGDVMVADDLGADERWPVYGPRAVESVGVLSSLAQPLHDGQRVVGALNLFSESRAAFRHDHEGDAVASILAAHATPALVAALQRETLMAAIETRDVIGQAKGMLMARAHIDEDAAFELLVRGSQRMQVKLAEVARRLVRGELHDDSRD